MVTCVVIRNIVFDFGNVLVRFQPEVEIRKLTHSNEEALALRNMVYQSEAFHLCDLGWSTREKCQEQLCARYPEKTELIRSILLNCSSWLTMPENTPSLLHALQGEDFKLYFLSNTNLEDYSFITDRYPVLGALPGIASFREHLAKPDPAIFACLLDRYHLSPRECLFVDDVAENTDAAARCGLQTLTLTQGADALGDILLPWLSSHT